MMNGQQYYSMRDLLNEIRRDYSDRILLRHIQCGTVETLTGREFFELTDACASRLYRMGLSGKHIGLIGANRWQWMVSLCAVFQVGATAVLLSPELNPAEISGRMVQADVDALLCDGVLSGKMAEACPVVISMDDMPEENYPYPEYRTAGENIACILFTSGTTAVPKAVAFSHRALLAGICHNVIRQPFESQLAILPMHHMAGFASVLNTWYLGRTVCMGEKMKYLYRYLDKMQPDYVLTVPSVLQAMIRKMKADGDSCGWNLKLIGCGGARFPAEAIMFLRQRGIRVMQSYGATEAGGIGFQWEMTPEREDSIGKPCPELEIKIHNGELYLRSASLMDGYYGDVQATQAVLQDGWYATGDLCEQDSDGYVYLRGRKNRVIILSNGENVSPEQIEQELSAAGVPGDVMVEVRSNLITACVYPVDGVSAETIETLIQHYNAGVPASRQVMNLKILNKPLKRTDTGKIMQTLQTGDDFR